VGDLPLNLQAKLLRVLQEREVVKVGARRPTPVDVRVVAATNVNLEEAVEAGRFRADLYYRFNVATVQLPPLRERPGDILPLARHFLELYGARLGYAEPELTGPQLAAEVLKRYQVRVSVGHINHILREVALSRVTGRPRKQGEPKPASSRPVSQANAGLFFPGGGEASPGGDGGA
jgi:transcriptional regulator with PAS, ATPase and Fis domain